MEIDALIIEITHSKSPYTPQYREIPKNKKTCLGRAYTNDIILGDPHICPKHLEIKHTKTKGWQLYDLDSDNGIWINKKRHTERIIPLKSGDEILIGKTKIRFLSKAHPVTEARELMPKNVVLETLSKRGISSLLFIVAILMIMAGAYKTNWYPDSETEIISISIAAAFIILIWSGIWSFIGRIICHHNTFIQHTGLISAFIILSTCIDYYSERVSFLLPTSSIVSFSSEILLYFVSGCLFYYALLLSTEVRQRRCQKITFIFILALFIGSTGMGVLKSKEFSSIPVYNYQMYDLPRLSNLFAEKSIPDYIEGHKVFFTDAFKKPPSD